MAELNVMELYGDFHRFIRGMENGNFFHFFRSSVLSEPVTVSVFEKYVERRVDMKWIEIIEDTIIPLDSIIRKPNSYIKREEDIIPIAVAREIGPESVRHLAQHTNMIASVKDDEVTPNKILNILKEDSIDTYENRFIHTLLKVTAYFLDKRMSILMKDTSVADQFEYQLDGNCNVGSDRFTYHMNMHLESPHEKMNEEQLINADVTKMTPLQRIERLRKILYTFQSSAFFKTLAMTPDVRPPLVMTNVLRKNPNFIKAVALWNFVNSYRDAGFSTEYIDRYKNPTEEERDEMFAVLMLEYIMIKRQTGRFGEIPEQEKVEEAVKQVSPNVISRSIDEICNDYNLTVDEVRRIFEKEFRKKEKKKAAELSRARGIFERAIAFEKENVRRKDEERRERIIAELKRRLLLAQEEARRAAELEARAKSQEEENLNRENGFQFVYRYSFMARLIQGQNPLQNYYGRVKNHLLSYTGVKNRVTWGYESFRLGNTVAKMAIRGKTLYLSLALDPSRFADTKYRVDDLSKEGKEVDLATRIKIRSERGVKYALELIDLMMSELGAQAGEAPNVDYSMPYETTEALLERDLVRKIGVPVEKKPAGETPVPEEKVSENAEPALPESESEEGEDADGEVLIKDGFVYRYRYSFEARLIQSGSPLQDYYGEIKNHIQSYDKVKSRIAWGYENFRVGRNTVVRMKIRGKTLLLFLAENPEAFDAKYHIRDLRKAWKEVALASCFRVKSDRGVKYAKEIIDQIFASLGLTQGKIPTEDYTRPYETTDALVEKGLVKLVGAPAVSAAIPETEPIPTDEEPETEVTEEAEAEVAEEAEAEVAEEPETEVVEEPETEVTEESETEVTEEAEAEVAEEPETEVAEEPETEVAEEPETEVTEESETEVAEEPEAIPAIGTVEPEPGESEPVEREPETPEVESEADEPVLEVESEADEPEFEFAEAEDEPESGTDGQTGGRRRRKNYKGLGRKKKKAMQKRDGTFEVKDRSRIQTEKLSRGKWYDSEDTDDQ